MSKFFEEIREWFADLLDWYNLVIVDGEIKRLEGELQYYNLPREAEQELRLELDFFIEAEQKLSARIEMRARKEHQHA